MPSSRPPAEFFDRYARDFDAIYGANASRLGRVFDRILRRSMLLRYQRTLAGCQPVAGRRVLDVGCGPGHYGVALASAGAARVVLLDPAAEMLTLARRRAQVAKVEARCEFVHAGFQDYSSAEPFDYCILMGLMDYMADARGCITHALELTRGRVFFSFPAAGGLLAAIRTYRYRRRTALYLYRRDELDALFGELAPGRHRIERIARDYFVEVDAAGGAASLPGERVPQASPARSPSTAR